MFGNMNNRIVGKCSKCGGIVSIPTVWMSVNRPIASCEKCGAYEDETAHLPEIPMKQRSEPRDLLSLLKK